jgi:hypothetical protein
MAATDNAAGLLPLSWQIIIGALIFATTIGGIAWRFLASLKAPESHDQPHVILERADLADMHAIRDLVRDFRPAIERLARIDTVACDTAVVIRDVQGKLERMEQAAIVAKQVREGVAHALREEREHQDQPFRRGHGRQDE